jgi:hypothetical protein
LRRHLIHSTASCHNGANAYESPLALSRRAGQYAKQVKNKASGDASSKDDSAAASTEPWIHPLSDLVLKRVRSAHADLDVSVTVNADGTIRVESALAPNSRLETAYVAETKCHLLVLVVDGKTADEWVIQDYSKSAWQVRLTPEDEVFEHVDRLCKSLRAPVQ